MGTSARPSMSRGETMSLWRARRLRSMTQACRRCPRPRSPWRPIQTRSVAFRQACNLEKFLILVEVQSLQLFSSGSQSTRLAETILYVARSTSNSVSKFRPIASRRARPTFTWARILNEWVRNFQDFTSVAQSTRLAELYLMVPRSVSNSSGVSPPSWVRHPFASHSRSHLTCSRGPCNLTNGC